MEDEPDIIEILEHLLTPICDKILTASNGVEALEVMKNVPEICAILSDVNMPKMNGLELLTHIRASFNPIPFVILTGHGDASNYQNAVKLNATDFLEKPFEPQAVTEALTRALDYGVQLIDSERKLDELYRSSGISQEKLEEIKRAKRTVMAMRIESNIYKSK